MTNKELEKLINDDIPKELSGKPDAISMLNKCKIRNIKRQGVIVKLSMTFSSLIIILIGVFSIVFGLQMPVEKENNLNQTDANDNYNLGKIENNVNNNGTNDEMIDDPNNPREHVMGWYGIEINIRCDYTKHSKYKEWEKEFYDDEYQNYQNDPYDTRPLSYHFIRFLNRKVYEYESMDNMLANQTNHSFWPGAEIIHVSYLARKDIHETMEEAENIYKDFLDSFYQSQDYNYLMELSKKDFILKIEIIERSPNDDGLMDE